MNAETIARVDAWLDSRRKSGMSEAEEALAHEWSRRPFRLALARTDAAREAVDSGMRGILLALVREAHENDTLTTNLAHFGWWVTGLKGGTTEDDALVVALEAAPAREAVPL